MHQGTRPVKPLWISSYPKSGNTWVRFIIADLKTGGVAESGQIERLVPDVHKSKDIPLPAQGPPLLKTHWMLSGELLASYPPAGAIYVVRNPLDVLTSVANYFSLDEPNAMSELVTEFVDLGGLAAWRREGYGSWEENVRSWALRDVDFPRLLITYEDLLAETEDVVRRIAAFLQIETDAAGRAETVRRTSFDGLKRLEERELAADRGGFFTSERAINRRLASTPASGFRFMNKGSFGGFAERLQPDQSRRLLDRFAPLMHQLGYDMDRFEAMI